MSNSVQAEFHSAPSLPAGTSHQPQVNISQALYHVYFQTVLNIHSKKDQMLPDSQMVWRVVLISVWKSLRLSQSLNDVTSTEPLPQLAVAFPSARHHQPMVASFRDIRRSQIYTMGRCTPGTPPCKKISHPKTSIWPCLIVCKISTFQL